MSNARKLADNLPSEGSLSGRNMIINGGMAISQRGTSFTNPSASAYTLDRWATTYSHDGAVDVSQSTTAPAGFKNSLKIDVTTADSSLSSAQYYILQQLIEGQNLSHLNYGSSDAKEVTISFWVRSNKTGTYCVEIQTSGGQELARPYTINTANTWEHKTLTWIANTDFTITETNAVGLYIYWWLAAGSAYSGSPIGTTWANNTNRVTGQTNFLDSTSNELYITGVQMEVGPQSTPFEHEPVGVTLSKAQRYYQEIYIFHDAGSSYLRETIPFRTTMRAAPTGYVYARRPDGTGTNTVSKIYQGGGETSAGISNQTTNSARLDSSGFTANTDIYGRVTLDAEL